MVKRLKWIDRDFGFDFPVGMFPMILARLRGTPARLDEIAHNLLPDTLAEHIDGGWSVKETVGHLISVESLHAGRLDDYDAGAEELRPADMSNAETYKARYNERDIDDLLKSFRSVREDLVRRIENLDEAGASRSAHHPRLNKQMRVVDIAYFAAEHDDQHMALIYDLL
ncbi:MAG: DinB family protein [Candidatus Zixiibacteriota bacterium]